MQETRLIQLNTAIQMELWQEAYKSAEDLHNIMQLSKDKDRRMVKPASYVNYYDKLALIFWKGGNILFHAAALLQKFVIYKDMKRSFTDEGKIFN
jgi:translation initiation factor 3 subunit A